MTTKKIEFPKIFSFEDYHDIDTKLEALREFEPKIKASEVDPENYGYVFDENFNGAMKYYGLFYIGRKPAKAIIEALVTKEFAKHPHWNKESIQLNQTGENLKNRFFLAIKQSIRI